MFKWDNCPNDAIEQKNSYEDIIRNKATALF